MVCKEDVLSWFKDLECYKRIDLMYELLNMCVPFEIRFMGSCIEEIGKHTYQELRGLTIIANDVEKLSKDNMLTNSLLDEITRSRVLLYISLLSTRNCLSANWLYKKLFRTAVFEDFVVKGSCKDDNLQSELLLLLTMSLHHPAFTFEQKTFFGNLLVHLIEQREGKKAVAMKPNAYCYPPGFGYPPAHIIPSHSEISVIPIKTASPLGTGDGNQHPPPPGLPIHPTVNPALDYIAPAVWQRPTFTATMCPPPESMGFPTRSISPLVSQPTSSPSSRGSSPHRNYTIRSVAGLPLPQLPQHNVEVQSNPSQVTNDQLTTPPSIPKFMPLMKSSEEELSHLQDDKSAEPHWLSQFDMKRPNGMQMFYAIDQMRALKLEGENSLHCSTSSSNSSLNQSPTQTPPAPLILPLHGPGRGTNGPAVDAKSRINGMPPPFMSGVPPPAAAPPPMCESTPPPPFSNCTVPYSNYPSHVSLTAIPNRCIFQYSTAYRPSFNTPFTYHHPDTVFTSPYLHLPIYSSVQQQQQQQQHQRNPPTCCNCGAMGHIGPDCTAQTIEDITQKAYSLEYSPLSDTIDK